MAMPQAEITGERIGSLVAISKVGANRHHQFRWRFACDCGKQRIAIPSALRQQRDPTCGRCHLVRGRKAVSLAGKQFGLWTVLSRAPNRPGEQHALWRVRCRCGTVSEVRSSHLTRGKSQSCNSCRAGNPPGKTTGTRWLSGANLRLLRQQSGIAARAAARLAGVSAARWYQWEQQPILAPAIRDKARAALGLLT